MKLVLWGAPPIHKTPMGRRGRRPPTNSIVLSDISITGIGKFIALFIITASWRGYDIYSRRAENTLKISQAVIVEGKYDKIKLKSLIDAVIIPTDGFSVFSDKEKLELIRHFARKTGIVILTDSDSAGFKIRNYLKGAVKDGEITNVYVPDIYGKEKRKETPSKEGKIGVEGISAEVILEAFRKAGVDAVENPYEEKEPITRLDFYDTGLSGGKNSSLKREKALKSLNLPKLLSVSSMCEVLNTMMTRQEFLKFALTVNESDSSA